MLADSINVDVSVFIGKCTVMKYRTRGTPSTSCRRSS